MAETQVVEKKSRSTKQKKELKISVYDIAGKEVKTVNLDAQFFAVQSNAKLIAQYVRVFLVNQRQGNASTKTRSEVIGTTKKVYRQKGTGNARHGSKKAPIFVGGGVTFGPQPRDFELKLSKKQKRLALLVSLSMKASEGKIMALENSVLDMKPQTKTVSHFLNKLGLEKKKVLIVVPKLAKEGLVLSARNIPNVQIAQSTNVNPYILLNNEVTIFTESAIELMEKHFTQVNAH